MRLVGDILRVSSYKNRANAVVFLFACKLGYFKFLSSLRLIQVVICRAYLTFLNLSALRHSS